MKFGLLLALALAVYVVFLLWKRDWRERIGLVAAVGFGLLVPQVLAALSGVAGSAAAMLSTAGW